MRVLDKLHSRLPVSTNKGLGKLCMEDTDDDCTPGLRYTPGRVMPHLQQMHPAPLTDPVGHTARLSTGRGSQGSAAPAPHWRACRKNTALPLKPRHKCLKHALTFQ